MRDWEGASFSRSTMVGERGKTCWKKLLTHWGRRGPFIGPHEKEPLQTTCTGDSGLPRLETPVLGRRLRCNSRPGTSTAPCFGRKINCADRRLRSRAENSGLQKNCRNTNTKTEISLSSELRFRCSWARWNRNENL